MIARVALTAALLCACVADEQLGRSHSAITRGTVDTGDPAVVAISLRRTGCSDPAPVPSCSGTLIHPRVVLTAAHCVEPYEAGVSYEVLFGASNTATDAKLRVVTARLRHPKFDPKTHEFDVALLRLADDAPATPIALATDAPVAGSTVRVVGYGTTEDPKVVPGTKRSGAMTITTVSESSFRAVIAPSNSCHGDSGGPVFFGKPEVLLAVTAAGDPTCREYAFNVRVDAVPTFITDFIQETEGTPKGPPAGVMSPEQVCTAPCVNSGDCPAALECLPTPAGPRCLLPGILAGDFGAQCGPTKKPCASGSTCARLWTEGDFACLCHTPCAGGVTPPPMDSGIGRPPTGGAFRAYGGGTCATSHEPGESTGTWLVMTVAMLAWVSRSLSRRALDPLCSGCRASSRGAPRDV